jgi:hypothetical protein
MGNNKIIGYKDCDEVQKYIILKEFKQEYSSEDVTDLTFYYEKESLYGTVMIFTKEFKKNYIYK